MRRLALTAALLASFPAFAEEMPHKVAMEFRVYGRLTKLAKAFAWNGADAYGYSYDARELAWAEESALKSCERNRKAQKSRQRNAAPCEIIDRQDKE